MLRMRLIILSISLLTLMGSCLTSMVDGIHEQPPLVAMPPGLPYRQLLSRQPNPSRFLDLPITHPHKSVRDLLLQECGCPY
jgi:hypothetical protein